MIVTSLITAMLPRDSLKMISPASPPPIFACGQLVKHRRYGYRGVVVDWKAVSFEGSPEQLRFCYSEAVRRLRGAGRDATGYLGVTDAKLEAIRAHYGALAAPR